MLWNRDLSLFSPQAISERPNRALLIQFLLLEIIGARRAIEIGKWEALLTSYPRFFPYDWSGITGYFNKIQEHSLLLEKSFSDRSQAVEDFEKTLSKEIGSLSKKRAPRKEQFKTSLQRIYTSLEPLLAVCKEDENLLFFLIKNHREIDSLIQKGHLHNFILEIHPCGLEILGEKMCDQYHQRGFFSQIPEFKLFLNELSNA